MVAATRRNEGLMSKIRIFRVRKRGADLGRKGSPAILPYTLVIFRVGCAARGGSVLRELPCLWRTAPIPTRDWQGATSRTAPTNLYVREIRHLTRKTSWRIHRTNNPNHVNVSNRQQTGHAIACPRRFKYPTAVRDDRAHSPWVPFPQQQVTRNSYLYTTVYPHSHTFV